MSKKMLAVVTMICLLPAVACAWSLNTWVKSAGGVMSSRNNAAQTSVNGSVFKSYTTSATLPVTVTANTGYTISNITRNGVSLGAQASPYSTTVAGASSQNVYATFAASLVSVTANCGPGGIVSPTSLNNVYYGQKAFSAVKFTFTPSTGYAIGPITGMTGTMTSATNANGVVTVTIPAGFVFSGSNVPIALSTTPINTSPVAKTGAPQTVLPNTQVTLDGSASTGTITSYTWAQTSGPAVTLTQPVSTSNATFTPTVVGVYKFNLTVTGGSIATATVTVTDSYSDAVKNACVNCHNSNNVGAVVFGQWSSGKHNSAAVLCANCHVGANAGSHPGVVTSATCANCHTASSVPLPAGHTTNTDCMLCHNSSSAHMADGTCIGCHAAVQNAGAGFVQDNNGVRAVVQEFSKWSHHVTGVALDNAHCAACHLEGKAQGGAIVVDAAYHMVDAKTHLRNSDTDADMQWDPAAPNHSTMDNYCMSCHDANGATSPMSVQIQTYINSNGIAAAGKTASAKNPFGDTISNRYDKMQRPGVVDVDSQFNTTNNSHHGVKGPRYSGRTRAAGPRQIANPAAFANNSSSVLWGKRSTIYDAVDAITGITSGPREALNQLYVPLENAGSEASPRTGAQTLGDDSTLHCGDCHTVGQWKPGTAQAFTPTNPATVVAGTSPAIGAHGSNNEYMLRNSRGTDERHTQDAYVKAANGNINLQNPNAAYLLCYNCHSYARYGSVFNATGTTGPHAGEYDASGRCNGVGNTIPFNGYTTGTATDGTQFVSRFDGPNSKYSTAPAFAPGFPLNFANAPGGVQAATYTGEQNPDFGNIFGIQCLNCHNSGIGNGYGGIHGSPNNSPGTPNIVAAGGSAVPDPSVTGGAYINGMGNTAKVQRFLPGLGNIMHVPGTLGGVTGGTTVGPVTNTQIYTYQTGGIMNDTNWEQVAWQQVAGAPVTTTARAGAGCYTLGEGATAAALGIEGEPVAGEGSGEVEAFGTWGGCDDHAGAPGKGDHGFIKRINRPVTY